MCVQVTFGTDTRLYECLSSSRTYKMIREQNWRHTFKHGELMTISTPSTSHFPLFTNPPFLSSAGLNDLYSATQKNLGTETKLWQQLEQELDMQKSIRLEKKVSYSIFLIIRLLSLYHNGMCVFIAHLTDNPPAIGKEHS